jgi:hypothetical protein
LRCWLTKYVHKICQATRIWICCLLLLFWSAEKFICCLSLHLSLASVVESFEIKFFLGYIVTIVLTSHCAEITFAYKVHQVKIFIGFDFFNSSTSAFLKFIQNSTIKVIFFFSVIIITILYILWVSILLELFAIHTSTNFFCNICQVWGFITLYDNTQCIN